MIVLTTFDADEHVVEALAAGADGFLLKDTPPPQIVDAIRKVADGEPMLSPSVTRTLIRQVRRHPARSTPTAAAAALGWRCSPTASATSRWPSAAGLSNAEIAAELYLSVPTVKAHVSRLFDKLGVTNRVQIAICVHDAGSRLIRPQTSQVAPDWRPRSGRRTRPWPRPPRRRGRTTAAHG